MADQHTETSVSIVKELEGLYAEIGGKAYRMWSFNPTEGSTKTLAVLSASKCGHIWTRLHRKKVLDVGWKSFKENITSILSSLSGTLLTSASTQEKEIVIMVKPEETIHRNKHRLDEYNSIELKEGWKVKHKFIVMHVGWEMDNWGVVAEGPQKELALYMSSHGSWSECPTRELENLVNQYEKNLFDSKKALRMLNEQRSY